MLGISPITIYYHLKMCVRSSPIIFASTPCFAIQFTMNLLRFYLLGMANLTHAQWKKGAMLPTRVGLLYTFLFCGLYSLRYFVTLIPLRTNWVSEIRGAFCTHLILPFCFNYSICKGNGCLKLVVNFFTHYVILL
jgi:hypothetical protein